MLCKVKGSSYEKVIANNPNFNQTYSDTETTVIEDTADLDGNFYFKTQLQGSWSDGRMSYAYLYVNGTKLTTYSYYASTRNDFSINKDLNKWDVVKVTVKWYNSAYKLGVRTLYSGIKYMDNLIVWVGGTPKQIKAIWEFIVVHLYGNNDKGVYKGGIITGTTNSVTTGSITLWNAVGYLEVNYNWNIVKIPYYN